MKELIIYELHVRGYTANEPEGGTFDALIKKIPHIKSLGITAVELLPITDFDSSQNFWGYSPTDFFKIAPHYGENFPALVHELHNAGIRCILDLVYNHTDPSADFPSDYYTGRNDSGCGNTLGANHPPVTELILRSLHHFAAMGVDGFRFDLASILTRGPDGAPLDPSPCIECINTEFGNHLLIAEPWDAAGLYQLGQFPKWGPWLEWNGSFRDTVRGYLKGDTSLATLFATRMAGSPDLYPSPYQSINYITCHDGFTLADLVSYNEKHNEANGEENRDGTDNNLSWNCGAEGPTEDPDILALRHRQMENILIALFTAQGSPMLQAGDEFAHTKQGNNNSWNQDNALNYIDHSNPIFAPLIQKLIALRPLPSPATLNILNWGSAIGLHYPELLIIFNPSPETISIQFPPGEWHPHILTGDEVGAPWSSAIFTSTS